MDMKIEEPEVDERDFIVKIENNENTTSEKKLKTESDVDIEKNIFVKKELDGENIGGTNVKIKKEINELEMKLESSSFEESVPEIEQEEIMLKSDDDRGAPWNSNSEKYGCNYKSSRKDNLTKHILFKDYEDSKTYSCDHCNYKTHRKSCLNNHALTKHDENAIKKYSCSQCDYQTHQKRDLFRHITSKHDKDAIKKYSCDHCNYKSHRKDGLKRHMRIRHDKNLSRQQHVNNFYVHVSNLTMEHNDYSAKNHDCYQCEYKKHIIGDLMKHPLIKNNENSKKYSVIRKYNCDQCNYKTNEKRDLNRHMIAKHDKTAIKRYGCDHCNYRSHRKDDLKRHVRLKHEEKLKQQEQIQGLLA